MDKQTGNNSDNSPQSNCSFSELDEWLDLDRPLTFAGFELPSESAPEYSSQLATPIRKSVLSDIDSGVDFDWSSSGSPFQAKNVRFRAKKTPIQRNNTNRLRSWSSLSTISHISDDNSSEETNVASKRRSFIEMNDTSSDGTDDSVFPKKQCFQNENSDIDDVLNNDRFTELFQCLSLIDETSKSVGLIFPEKIRSIFMIFKSNYSDYSFAHAISSQMCQKMYPMDCHTSLKLALLLSIISCNDRSQNQPISIIAVTQDTSVASTIMRHIGKCAKRFITISDDLKYSSKVKEGELIEANSLLLARNGVCYIGDWQSLKTPSLNYLKNVLDTDQVVAETSTNTVFRTKCAVWMYWSCAARTLRQNQNESMMISRLFGIPVILDDIHSGSTIEFLLNQCSNDYVDEEPEDGLIVDDDDMKTFLNIVSNIQVQMDAEADALIKCYFIVTRSLRPNILSQKSYAVLTRLAECHAKLCLRNKILRLDIIASIAMFEKYVVGFYGPNMSTAPILCKIDSFEQIEEHMRKFEEWLEGYLGEVNDRANFFLNDFDYF